MMAETKAEDAPQLNPFSKGYNHRNGKPVSDACGDGRHSECTETYMACHCTYRGGHKTPHAYLNTPVADSVVQGEPQLRTSADYAWHVREAYADGCECAMCKLVRELLAGVTWQMACFISAALRSETFRNSVTYDEEVQGESPAKPALEKLLRWIVEDTRELAKGRSLEMSDIESLLAHAEEACQSVFGCSLSSFRDGEPGASPTRPDPHFPVGEDFTGYSIHSDDSGFLISLTDFMADWIKRYPLTPKHDSTEGK